ncbi:MAG: hypothetical protein QOE47_2971 [Pyrinomonadaceae bacterium]|jgi:hypothetical protein|nr:hypothetical protein [Pyrinomonadaceae bacterium]
MNLRDNDDTPEETNATAATNAASAAPTTDALAHLMPVVLKRDFIQLLLQSPTRLYLYWTFAHDPHATLREAFGELAAHYRLMARLVNVESGEEFLMDAPRERAQWFEVYPRHVYRAEVGFHAANRPFVRLLSSNAVTTPPDRASHLSAEEVEFRLEAGAFAQLLGSAGYERYARAPIGDAAGGGNLSTQGGALMSAAARPGAGADVSHEVADEYPHR